MTVSPRTWPDATAKVITGLNAALTPTVYPTVPNPLVDEFVVVTRVGGAQDGVLDFAEFDVECWSGEEGTGQVACNTLATTVREKVRLLRDSVTGIASTTEGGYAFLVDGATNRPRIILNITVVLKPT